MKDDNAVLQYDVKKVLVDNDSCINTCRCVYYDSDNYDYSYDGNYNAVTAITTAPDTFISSSARFP